jgi:hypothetical protein
MNAHEEFKIREEKWLEEGCKLALMKPRAMKVAQLVARASLAGNPTPRPEKLTSKAGIELGLSKISRRTVNGVISLAYVPFEHGRRSS